MDYALIFGNIGNLGNEIGTGWSIEDAYAWAVGAESRLTLPVSGRDSACMLRFDVHPLIDPKSQPHQSLTFLCGADVLARFQLERRGTIEIEIPAQLVAGRDRIELSLIHPQPLRPADFLDSKDTRPLSVCFHSGRLSQEDPTLPVSALTRTETVAVVVGNYSALQLARIARNLPSLRGRCDFVYADPSTLSETLAELPLERARFCWLQSNAGRGDVVQSIRGRLPADCLIRRFYLPDVSCLWPFNTPDPRSRPEPGRYRTSRYPYGDRIAAGLATYPMADDTIWAIYDGAVRKELPDLDLLFATDVQQWKRADSRNDIKIAATLEASFKTERLFVAPNIPSIPVLRMVLARMLEAPEFHALAPRARLTDEIVAATEGYVGRREEVPIHPAVAEHFGLTWWNPDMAYRWHGNRLTLKDWILDYIRWNEWRP